MPSSARRVYWDSCVFLAYIDGVEERLPTLDAVLGDAEQGNIELLTATLSIAEVACGQVERSQQRLSPHVLERIEQLWIPPSPIKLVELHTLIAEEARDLIRSGLSKGWTGLKGADALHLATARRMQVDEFHTYDARLRRYSGQLGFTIREPFTNHPRLPFPVPSVARDPDDY